MKAQLLASSFALVILVYPLSLSSFLSLQMSATFLIRSPPSTTTQQSLHILRWRCVSYTEIFVYLTLEKSTDFHPTCRVIGSCTAQPWTWAKTAHVAHRRPSTGGRASTASARMTAGEKKKLLSTTTKAFLWHSIDRRRHALTWSTSRARRTEENSNRALMILRLVLRLLFRLTAKFLVTPPSWAIWQRWRAVKHRNSCADIATLRKANRLQLVNWRMTKIKAQGSRMNTNKRQIVRVLFDVCRDFSRRIHHRTDRWDHVIRSRRRQQLAAWRLPPRSKTNYPQHRAYWKQRCSAPVQRIPSWIRRCSSRTFINNSHQLLLR